MPGFQDKSGSYLIAPPGVRCLIARAGSESQFEHAAEDLLCCAGLKGAPREVERVSEEVGRQVEHWLGQQQNQLLQKTFPLSYISFEGPACLSAKTNW